MLLTIFTVEGTSNDFAVPSINNLIQHVFVSSPPTLNIIFRTDNQVEPDETFALKLESNSLLALPEGTGVYYRQILQCIIVDTNG